MAQHPTSSELQQWLDGRLDAAASDEIEAHLATCAEVCPTILEHLSNGEAPPTVAPPVDGRPPAAPPHLEDGDTPRSIGRYRIERLLGAGGFGRVFLGHDDQLKRRVAIKMPRQDRFSQTDVDAYLSEARVLASLDHPNIVQVHDVGTTGDGMCFIVSKFIEASDLTSRLKESPLSVPAATKIVTEVADALHYAHWKGVFHRDIKPGNVLLDGTGKAYVADFGLALKAEDVGHGARYAGTLAYMSPEQARGEGHRVDGRSDIFSLGVVLYELLTGKRPFRGDSQAELIEQITTSDPRPPRQVDDTLPKELERICLKALSKRASERYMTAKDLADDLRHFLATYSTIHPTVPATKKPSVSTMLPAMPAPAAPSALHMPSVTPTPISASDNLPIKIVPKGLRSFDAHDADFFLELLPGPRDRDGLPDSLRFWKTRIEEADQDNAFSVGLIYGPSGCGKSSLVKAGLLPRLSDKVVVVYVEATTEETETRLLNGLRKRCPGLSPALGLKDTLAAVRRGQAALAGKKVLIVIDQFEQWLHANRERQNTDLAQGLRQCDGERLQCIVMVRDDFWLVVSRFMRELEVRLVEGQNSALVDLFDADHARKVLAAFGRAFGRLPINPAETSKEQKQFLTESVKGLAQEGKVFSVRLALFAEMMKGKPWTPASLHEMGGTEGVGFTFLEETFSTATAPPDHRYHQKAARSVLKALLPESGTDIKGNMRSYPELLEASGYANRPKDFDDLVRILDREIRLITPTDPEGKENVDDSMSQVPVGQKYYQLTHDYLVHSLRDWLTRKQKETRRGRAEILLADRAAGWNGRPDNRHLPGWWEWANIRLFTRSKDWTPVQGRMMRRAGRYYFSRALILVLVISALTVAGVMLRNREDPMISLRRQEIIRRVEAISRSSPHLDKVSPHPLSEVDQAPGVNYEGFQILEDHRIIDLRSWQPGKSGVTMARSLHLVKNREADEILFEGRTSGRDMIFRCIFPNPQTAKLINSRSDKIVAGQKMKSRLLSVDIRDFPVHDEFEIKTVATYWDSLQRPDERWFGVIGYEGSLRVSMLLLFPKDRPYLNKPKFYVAESSNSPLSPYVGPQILFIDDDGHWLYWEVSHPKAKHVYRVDWEW